MNDFSYLEEYNLRRNSRRNDGDLLLFSKKLKRHLKALLKQADHAACILQAREEKSLGMGPCATKKCLKFHKKSNLLR